MQQQPAPPPRPTYAQVAFRTLQFAVLLAAGAQVAIDRSFDNLVASVLVLMSSTVTLQYLQRTRAFTDLPISAFAVLGLCITTQWGALVAQSIAWTPVAEKLWDPIRTFSWLGLFQLVAVLAHWLFRSLRFTMTARDVMAVQVMRPLGIFQLPSCGNLWVMGAVGLAAMLASGTAGDTGAGNKLLSGLTFLAWAPFIIPVLHQRHGKAYCDIHPQSIALGIYFFMAGAVGMALNFRAVLFAGVVTALLLFLLLVLGDERPAQLPKPWKILLAVIIGSLAVAYAGDLAMAMAIARKDRGSASLLTMIQETFLALSDRKVMEVYRAADLETAMLGTYSEVYISNHAVARFVETKFHDNALFLSKNLQLAEIAELRRVTSDRLWGILPKPVLGWIGVSLNKEVEQAFSMGDFFDYLKHGNMLGGFKTGSIFGHGLALFPFGFPFIYFLICLVLFLMWDMQSRRTSLGLVEISPLAMLSTYRLFTYGITSESLAATAAFPLRGVWQSVALYALVFWVSRLVFKPFDPAAAKADSALIAADIVGRRR